MENGFLAMIEEEEIRKARKKKLNEHNELKEEGKENASDDEEE